MAPFYGKYTTSYLMKIVIFVLLLAIYEVFANQIKCQTVDLEIEGQGQGGENGLAPFVLAMFDCMLVFFYNVSYTVAYVYATLVTHTNTLLYKYLHIHERHVLHICLTIYVLFNVSITKLLTSYTKLEVC